MNKVLLLLGVFSFIAVSSCKNVSEEKSLKTFSRADFLFDKRLKGINFTLDSIEKPVNITVIPERNILIVLNATEQPFLAAVYSLDSIKFIRSFIARGPLDDEQLIAYSLRYLSGSKYVYVSDIVKSRIFGYAIDSILKRTAKCTPVSISRLRNKDLSPLQLTRPVISQNFKGFIDINSNHVETVSDPFCFFDSSGKLLRSAGTYPHHDESYKPYLLSNIFDGAINLSGNNKLIYTYFNTDVIDVYDSTGILLNRIHGPDKFWPKFKIRKVGKGEMVIPDKMAKSAYMAQSRMNNKSLFALYSGLEIRQNNYHCVELFELSDKLIPQIRYTLDQPIFDFDINWTTKTIYGLSHQGGNKIIIYKY